MQFGSLPKGAPLLLLMMAGQGIFLVTAFVVTISTVASLDAATSATAAWSRKIAGIEPIAGLGADLARTRNGQTPADTASIRQTDGQIATAILKLSAYHRENDSAAGRAFLPALDALDRARHDLAVAAAGGSAAGAAAAAAARARFDEALKALAAIPVRELAVLEARRQDLVARARTTTFIVTVMAFLFVVSAGGIGLVGLRRAASADAQLRLTADGFAAFAALGSDLLMETDRDHRIVWLSGPGLTPQIITASIGRDPVDLLPESARGLPETDEISEKIAAREPYGPLILPMTHRGRTRWLEVRAAPKHDRFGEFDGYRTVATDVTERVEARRQVEAALQRAQSSEAEARAAAQRFRASTEISADAIWETGPDLKLTYVSGGIRSLGFAPEQAIGFDTLTGAALDALTGSEAQQHLEALTFRMPFRTPAGRLVWMQSSAEPRFSADGEFIGYRGVSRDVSALVETRRSLEDAQRRKERIVQGADVFFYRCRIERGYPVEMADGAVERLTGWPTSDFLSGAVRFIDIIHPDDRELYAARMRSSVENDEPVVVETRIVRRDGTVRWLQHRASAPERDCTGRPIAIEGMFLDVTAMRELLEELAERDSRFESLTANLDGMIFRARVTADGPIIEFMSASAERITGLPSQALVGTRLPRLDSIHPEDVDWLSNAYARVMRGEPFEVTYRGRSSDGGWRWFVQRAQPFGRDPNGRALWIDGFVVDITDQRELAAENERLAGAIARVDAGIVIADMESVGQPLVFVNDAFTRITGYTRKEVIGRNCRFLQGFGTDPAAVGEIRAAIRERRSTVVEILNYRKDGTPFWNELTLNPISDAEGRLFYVAVQHDVTRRRAEAEELERARDTAEAANRAKSQFLAMMSHEIRTPMNGVIGIAEALLMGDMPDAVRRKVEIIRNSGHALSRIIDDILDLSKLEAGRIEILPSPCDPVGVAEYAAEIVRGHAKEKAIALEVTVDPAAPRLAMVDEGRLRQIVVNLLGNAVKFTEQGRVTLAITAAGDGRMRFAVTDTGIGIPPDRLPNLFAEFTQGDGSITRRFGGTGLGLAISRRLAQLMGGDITVESEVGRGSCFTLEIATPAAAAGPEAESGRATAEAMLSARPPLRILPAEDNETNVIVARLVLERIGAIVTHAANGREAVEAAAGGAFDAVLMDIHMPEMDGYEAARRIRYAKGSALPVIALSAGAFAGEVEKAREAGMVAHVAKPLRAEKLFAALAQVLGLDGTAVDTAPVPAEDAGPATFDREQAQRLIDDMGLRGFAAVAEAFREDAAGLIALIEAGSDGEVPMRTAHSIKSAAALEKRLAGGDVVRPGEPEALASAFEAWKVESAGTIAEATAAPPVPMRRVSRAQS